MDINEHEAKPRRSHSERRAATRSALLNAGRKLFSEEGYEGITVEDLVGGAGVTRGAMYHYFEDKRALFRAVAEEVNNDIDALVEAAARAEYEKSGDAFELFMAGTYAYLDACLKPEVRTIVLTEGPGVLGWEEWHEMDAAHALAQIEAGLDVMMRDGVMEPQPKRLLSHLLHGAQLEAAMYVAASQDPEEAKKEAGDALRRLTEGLCRRDSRGEKLAGERQDGKRAG